MKKILSALITLCIIAGMLPAIPAAADNALNYGIALMVDNTTAYADREIVELDVPPIIQDGRTLVPVRIVAKSCDAYVTWTEATRTVEVELNDNIVLLTIDSNIMLVNYEPVELEVPAQIIDGRTLIPLRAMAESIGQHVFWDERGLILITGTEIDANKDKHLIETVFTCLTTGEPPSFIQSSSALSHEVLEKAFGQRAVLFNLTSNQGGGDQEQYGSKGLYYLCLAATLDPDTKYEDGVLASDHAVGFIKSLVAGGNEPPCSNGPAPAHADITSALTLAKHTPAVWSQLTPDEVKKVDLIMKSFAISSNWGFNDCNDYKTGLALVGNFDKEWNPNFRCAGLIPMLNCVIYFGNADEVNKIFTTFSYDAFMKELADAKFTNIITTWEKTGKDLMENGGAAPIQDGGKGAGVKNAFIYHGMPLSDVEGIFEDLVGNVYGATVISSLGVEGTKEYAYIIDGTESPYVGRKGMMFEFHSMDAKGMRSCANYCTMSAGNIIPFLNTLKMLRGWDGSTKQQQECEELIYVGTEDLFYKLEHGYQSYSKGNGYTTNERGQYNTGLHFYKDIWRNVMGYEAE